MLGGKAVYVKSAVLRGSGEGWASAFLNRAGDRSFKNVYFVSGVRILSAYLRILAPRCSYRHGGGGARWRSCGRQMMALVWFRRAEVCLHLPGRSMAPSEPARAPTLACCADCAERAFGFHALTGWFGRRSPMSWTIGNVCRMQLLNMGLLGRCSVQNMELCAPAQLDLLAPGTDCSDALCDGDTVPVARVGGGRQKPAAARVLCVNVSAPSALCGGAVYRASVWE